MAFDPAAEELDNDRLFARRIAANNVVTGLILAPGGRDGPPPPKSGTAFAGSDARGFLPDRPRAVRNLDVIDEAATGIGVINFTPQADGVVRKAPMVFVSGGDVYPSLAAEALRVAQGAGALIVRASDGSGEGGGGDPLVTAVKVGAFEIPTDAGGEMRVHHSPWAAKSPLRASWLLATPANGTSSGGTPRDDTPFRWGAGAAHRRARGPGGHLGAGAARPQDDAARPRGARRFHPRRHDRPDHDGPVPHAAGLDTGRRAGRRDRPRCS